MAIRHAGYWKPKIYPYNRDVAPVEIDRLQELRGAPALPVEHLYEIGRKDKLCSKKKLPEVAMSARQFEYGSLEFFQALANKPYSGDTITLDDLSDAFFDIVGFEGEDASTLKGSILYPKARLNSLGLNIGDPDAVIERSFDMTADGEIVWQNANLYWIWKRKLVESGELESDGSVNIVVSDPFPVADPDLGDYLFRVLRVRGTDTEFLDENIDFTYVNGTHTLNIPSAEVGDVYKYYYTATTYIGGQQYHTLNDVDSCALYADCASIYLIDGLDTQLVHRLSSINIETSFDRLTVKEVGNKDSVETGIKSKNVRITTTGLVSSYELEEILLGKRGTNYGKLDITKFKDTLSLVIKIFSDSDKDTFKIGYKIDNIAVSAKERGIPVNDFITKGVTLESDNISITTNESSLGV